MIPRYTNIRAMLIVLTRACERAFHPGLDQPPTLELIRAFRFEMFEVLLRYGSSRAILKRTCY
jgi:hypothetical protein